MPGHGGRSASSAKHHAYICQIQISDKRFIMRFQGIECPAVIVPCNGKQRRFHSFSLDTTVKCTETFNKCFELCRHPVVIKGRDKIFISFSSPNDGLYRHIHSILWYTYSIKQKNTHSKYLVRMSLLCLKSIFCRCQIISSGYTNILTSNAIFSIRLSAASRCSGFFVYRAVMWSSFLLKMSMKKGRPPVKVKRPRQSA